MVYSGYGIVAKCAFGDGIAVSHGIYGYVVVGLPAILVKTYVGFEIKKIEAVYKRHILQRHVEKVKGHMKKVKRHMVKRYKIKKHMLCFKGYMKSLKRHTVKGHKRTYDKGVGVIGYRGKSGRQKISSCYKRKYWDEIW